MDQQAEQFAAEGRAEAARMNAEAEALEREAEAGAAEAYKMLQRTQEPPREQLKKVILDTEDKYQKT